MSKSSLNKITINKKELAYFHRLIFILISIRIEIVAIYYNKPLKDYLEVEKTTKLITRNYYIPNLR